MALKPKHENSGDCPKCNEIFNAYSGFHWGLRDWFKQLQAYFPEAHISDAGRGSKRQEEYFKIGRSKCHYKESAHNYNAAIDIFGITDHRSVYSREWFEQVVEFNYDKDLFKWYGEEGSRFKELPHMEVKNWRELVKDGKLKLVE